MQDMAAFVQLYPVLSLILLVLLSLCVGSCLNVIIHRLPQMLYRQWATECREFLATMADMPALPTPYTLSRPRSHCPHCKHALRIWHNIPLVSYVLLRGRCGYCQHAVSWRYPFVELLAGVCAIAVVMQFGCSVAAGAALGFSWLLIAMSCIDIDKQILPDNLNYLLLWSGLLVNLASCFATPQDAILGAVIGYVSLWSITACFNRSTGKQAMGHGDFKLCAALGAWVGWHMLPCLILLASVFGSILGIIQLRLQKKDHHTPIPFGPYLASAGWLCLLYGNVMTQYGFPLLRW